MEICIYPDAGELALNAARRFARLADRYVSDSGRFTVALSGGSTPKLMFSLLAAEPFLKSIPWASIFFFWGDERCVPADDEESNYRMAEESLLSIVPIPPGNIFRIPADHEDHLLAADEYSQTLRRFFGDEHPKFDLVFLGMGADGHTASLFPQTDALQINDRIAVANHVEKLGAWRITLTAATINLARHILFLVAGADKALTLKTVIEGRPHPDQYPSQLIKPVDGELVWMVDQAAAKLLSAGGTR